MTDISARWRKVAAGFSDRVREVPAGAWDDPAPCEGWVARDIVRHLVDWVNGALLASAGAAASGIPSVDDDPGAAWAAVDRAMQAAIDDPALAGTEIDFGPGRFRLDAAVDMFATGDVLIHTWDLARATGLDETLDPDEVHAMFEGMLPMDEVLRSSGQFGPRVVVPDDADELTQLIAFTGRQP